MMRELRSEINETWEYAVKSEKYSRKNNVRIHGLEDNTEEDLETQIIGMAKDELGIEIKMGHKSKWVTYAAIPPRRQVHTPKVIRNQDPLLN